jgi:hypothetical protein
MANVFVSFSSKDNHFVSLLMSLLRYHYVDCWCSQSDLEPGNQFPTKIESAIKNANMLLVVASSNTTSSKWVTKEIATFQAQQPEAKVIPLLLDSTNLEQIIPGLNSFQSIDFSKSYLSGYENLFLEFGKKFLPFADRRNNSGRRDYSDRRTSERRGVYSIKARMRKGLWKAYSLETGYGEFEPITLGYRVKQKILTSLNDEIGKYEYFDPISNQNVTASNALETASYQVFSVFKDREVKAIYLIEAIAEEICDQYKIKLVDRRSDSRRERSDRRKNNIN